MDKRFLTIGDMILIPTVIVNEFNKDVDMTKWNKIEVNKMVKKTSKKSKSMKK